MHEEATVRRDMDLVRRILIDVSESNEPLKAAAFVTDTTLFATVVFHLELMNEAGLIDATFARSLGGSDVTVNRLTWEGSDFLDAVASDNVWTQTKTKIAKTVGSAPFEVIKALAVKISTDLLMK